MSDLPITPKLPNICQTLVKGRRLVLSAEPGAGKSTQVPLALLAETEFSSQQIILLEPRRVAVKALAEYLAASLGETVGKTVGYQVRNEAKHSSSTRLLIVTEGILTRKIQSDPELNGVACVIFDEFHERSVHGDLGLLLCREIQQGLREDLAVLVMSATLDSEQVSRYLDDAPVITCEGRSFPIDIEYQPLAIDSAPSPQIGKKIAAELSRTSGDILVFLAGQSDIRRVQQWCEDNVAGVAEFYPLYGAMDLKAQQRLMRPTNDSARRVILATNIAQTSLTIPNITSVIDTGLHKMAQFDLKSGLTRLVTQKISAADAMQRAGRTGRVQAGRCIRLWAQSQQLVPFTPVEIARVDPTDLMLELTAWGHRVLSDAPWLDVDWLDAPPMHHLGYARDGLQRINAISRKGQITTHGQALLGFGLDWRSAHMILCSLNRSSDTAVAAVVLAALLGERDVLLHAESVDVRLRVAAVMAFCHDEPAMKKYHHGAMLNVAHTVQRLCRKLSLALPKQLADGAVLEACMIGFAERLAKRSGKGYTMAMGRGVVLDDVDGISRFTWCIVLDADAQHSHGRVFLAMPVMDEALLSSLPVHTTVQAKYSNNTLNIIERTRFGALTIQDKVIAEPNPETYQKALCDVIHTQGLGFLHWDDACERWLSRVKWLGITCPDRFPQIDEAYLLQNIDTWLLAYQTPTISIKALQQIALMPLLNAVLEYEQQSLLAKEAPERYLAPSGQQVSIRYSHQHAPTVSLPLQWVFGELASPRLGCNKVPLRFELLSPARRPIQTTQDLAGFWQSSYQDVVKDMRGRYPKHRWPDDPLSATAGASIKRR